MSNKACYDVNDSSEIAPPASDKHANRGLAQQSQQLDLQTYTQVKQGTDLQYRPDPIGNEVAASHLDETQSQIDGIITHDNPPVIRNARHSDDHGTSGVHVDDTNLIVQTPKESFHALNGVINGHKDLREIDGHDQVHTKSYDQVHDDVAPAMMQTSHDKTCAFVGGSSGQPASQADRMRDQIETPPCVDDHTNTSPTMLANLQHKAYGLLARLMT